MNFYINRLIITMVMCQIATVLSPDVESAKRCIRMVCSVLILLTLLSPLKYLVSAAGEICEQVTGFFTTESSQEYDEKEAGAVGLMQYITEKYGMDELSMVICTDETDTQITELWIYLENCPYTTRVTIETELTELLGVPVSVSTE